MLGRSIDKFNPTTMSFDQLENLKNDIECVPVEIMSIVPVEIWKKIMISFFSGLHFKCLQNDQFFKLQLVCKKWTKAFFSIGSLNVRKDAPPAFWERFVGLKKLTISQDCMITCSNREFAFLEKLDLENVNRECTIDFSYLTNLTELSISYQITTPENIQCLKKLKILVTMSCPAMGTIVGTEFPMLEKIILVSPLCVMDADILNSSPKLKIVGIYNLCSSFVTRYVSCLTSMKHQIELETDQYELLQNGITGTCMHWENSERLATRKSQNWYRKRMNGLSFRRTYAKSTQLAKKRYYRCISMCDKISVEDECIGHCTDGRLCGNGTIRQNGNVYSGMWEKDVPVGNFTVEFKNGDHYYGNMDRFCRLSGNGTLTRSDGSVIVSSIMETDCLAFRF